ncbi:MAG: glycosyltransferase family 2 protein [Candidatus Shapirobacteria bacterium]|jgi:glycosyltransferase involved in cell wall biosynthesis
MKIAIIVPVYNEGQRAVNTIKEILKLSEQNLVVVDDGSVDNSWSLLKKNYSNKKRVTLLRHVINLGKGAAMKTGAEKAWQLGAEAIIYIDADGQHNPAHLSDFEKSLRANELVFGYRSFNSKMPFIRKYGNIIALKLVEFLFNIKRKDLLCGFLGMKKEVYEKILWQSPRYGIETEMATRVGKNKIPFSEINVDTIYIDKYKGVTILDALKILFNIPFWYVRK